MKLSMWMIANQLLDLDPVLEIAEDAPAILNSARLAYATNCVYIYQEGNQVVCNGEGDRIIIRDMELNRVFELIQAIFDSYEDLDGGDGTADPAEGLPGDDGNGAQAAQKPADPF